MIKDMPPRGDGYTLRNAIAESRAHTGSVAASGTPEQIYWWIYNSGIDRYNETFRGVLGSSVLDHVSKMLTRSGGVKPLVVDFMASTSAVRSLDEALLNRGMVGIDGIAVSLTDDIREQKLRSGERNIRHFPGNLGRLATLRDLESSLNGRKIDLIIERGLDGLKCVPNHGGYYGPVLNEMWGMLNTEGGEMLLQTPGNKRLSRAGLPGVEEVARKLDDTAGVEARASVTDEDEAVLFIRRTPEAPEILTFAA